MEEVHLEEEDILMEDPQEEETEEDQTNWWEIHLWCSWGYEQKLSTSLLNESFTLALTSIPQL